MNNEDYSVNHFNSDDEPTEPAPKFNRKARRAMKSESRKVKKQIRKLQKAQDNE